MYTSVHVHQYKHAATLPDMLKHVARRFWFRILALFMHHLKVQYRSPYWTKVHVLCMTGIYKISCILLYYLRPWLPPRDKVTPPCQNQSKWIRQKMSKQRNCKKKKRIFSMLLLNDLTKITNKPRKSWINIQIWFSNLFFITFLMCCQK